MVTFLKKGLQMPSESPTPELGPKELRTAIVGPVQLEFARAIAGGLVRRWMEETSTPDMPRRSVEAFNPRNASDKPAKK